MSTSTTRTYRADTTSPLPTVGIERMAQNVTKTSDADYLSQFSASPYGFRANKRVEVEGKSNLKGSWRRQPASGSKQS